ncbi:hypothetical protein ACIA6T_10630 [Streptomyces sp. NPDC051740]|uniref:hypothetical protein n=1 Tax=Streptomyces sp. NPDC051740 TaxID=3365673 RepID=UPI003789F3F1
MTMDLSFYKSDLSEEIREEARAEGAAQCGAENVLIVLEVRGINVPEAVRERVTGCDDLKILRRWHRRAVTAPTAEDIFEDE